MKDEDAMTLLKRHPIFGTAPLIAEDAAGLEVLKYPPDAMVVRAGAEQRAVLVLIEGTAALHARVRVGGRQFLAGLVDAPSVIGDEDRHAETPWSYSVRTARAATFVSVPNAIFDRWIRADATLASALYRSACVRASRMRNVLERMLLEPTDQQILTLLWDLSRPPAAPGDPAIAPLSQSRLARALGVDRKTIGRNIRRLTEQGVLRVQGREASLLVDRRQSMPAMPSLRRGVSTWRIAEFRRRRSDVPANS
ncbi:MAG: Crp/Fnr family transcriptional regulator [Myxococcota bacterium]